MTLPRHACRRAAGGGVAADLERVRRRVERRARSFARRSAAAAGEGGSEEAAGDGNWSDASSVESLDLSLGEEVAAVGAGAADLVADADAATAVAVVIEPVEPVEPVLLLPTSGGGGFGSFGSGVALLLSPPSPPSPTVRTPSVSPPPSIGRSRAGSGLPAAGGRRGGGGSGHRGGGMTVAVRRRAGSGGVGGAFPRSGSGRPRRGAISAARMLLLFPPGKAALASVVVEGIPDPEELDAGGAVAVGEVENDASMLEALDAEADGRFPNAVRVLMDEDVDEEEADIGVGVGEVGGASSETGVEGCTRPPMPTAEVVEVRELGDWPLPAVAPPLPRSL